MTEPLCGCGAPATTEVQVGWDRHANGGAGGGVYEPVCDTCWPETADAEQVRVDRARHQTRETGD